MSFESLRALAAVIAGGGGRGCVTWSAVSCVGAGGAGRSPRENENVLPGQLSPVLELVRGRMCYLVCCLLCWSW